MHTLISLFSENVQVLEGFFCTFLLRKLSAPALQMQCSCQAVAGGCRTVYLTEMAGGAVSNSALTGRGVCELCAEGL